jgi:hypothetical protein
MTSWLHQNPINQLIKSFNETGLNWLCRMARFLLCTGNTVNHCSSGGFWLLACATVGYVTVLIITAHNKLAN